MEEEAWLERMREFMHTFVREQGRAPTVLELVCASTVIDRDDRARTICVEEAGDAQG